MIDIQDAVDLFAELSLALAGFAGVVAAFAGREREFRPIERMRLIGVVVLSASVLGGCLGFISASIAELSPRVVVAVAGLVSLILYAPLYWILPELWRRSRDADANVDPWSLNMVTILAVVETLLLSSAVLGLGNGWQLATSYSFQLLQGVWLFFLLLTRRN